MRVFCMMELVGMVPGKGHGVPVFLLRKPVFPEKVPVALAKRSSAAAVR